jgi:hypothetical protein
MAVIADPIAIPLPTDKSTCGPIGALRQIRALAVTVRVRLAMFAVVLAVVLKV